MYKIIAIARKFWCLEGFVAIIFSIFTISHLLRDNVLWAILMGIFSYWWIQRVLAKPTRYRIKYSHHNCQGPKDLDL